MPQERVFADFRQGMNALMPVDKLAEQECLLAENVRLDEQGNIQSAGATTRQNSAPYADSSGTANVHSLYWNPGFGAVAGVGQDVFQGIALGTMTSALTGSNGSAQKISFASAPNRVYFDVGNVGYWSDISANLLTVDWPPPQTNTSGGATVTSSAAGTASNSGTQTQTWTNVNNLTSTTTANVSSVFVNYLQPSKNAACSNFGFALGASAIQGIAIALNAHDQTSLGTSTITAILLKNGVPVGNSKTAIIQTQGSFVPVNFGGATDLWGATWVPGDINAATWGVSLQVSTNKFTNTDRITAYGVIATIYQSNPALGFGAGTGPAGTLTGTYTWKVTFVAANGEESDGSNPSTSVVLSAQAGTVTAIPTGDSRTASRNIYRSGGALTTYYLVGSIPDNTSSSFLDNQTDIAALTAGVILAGAIPGDYPNSRLGNQAVRFPEYHYDRAFWIVPGTNKIVWSKPLNGFAYPVVNFLNVGDSKPCTRLISIFGELIIFKSDSIWRLTGNDEASFDLTQTPSAQGTDLSFTISRTPDKVLFANRYGPWLFNGYTSQPLTPKLDLWWLQEDRTNKSLFGVNGFHPLERASASVPLNFDAAANSDKYYLSYAEKGQASNNAVLVFDLKHGNITKRPVGALALAIDPVNGFVYMGDSSGFVSLLDDFNGANGGGASVNFDYQHGYVDLQRGSNKALWSLEFYLNTNGQSLTPSVMYDNGAAQETLAAITTTGLQRVVRTCESPTSRKCQNWSWRLNGALTQVNSAGTPQVQIVHVKAFYDIRVGRARTGQ